MKVPGAEKNVDLRIRLGFDVREPKQAGFIVVRLRDSLYQRSELKRYDIQLNSDLSKVVLHQGRCLRARPRAGVCDHRELDEVPIFIEQLAALQLETVVPQRSNC